VRTNTAAAIPDPRLNPHERNQTKRRLEDPTFPTPARKKKHRTEGASLLQLPRITEGEAREMQNMYPNCVIREFRECEALHLEYFKIFPKREGVIINVVKKDINIDKRLGDRYRIKVYIQGTGTQQLIGKIDAELRNVKFVDKVHKISPDTCTVLNHYGGIAMRTIRQKLHCSIRLRTESGEGHSEVCISGEQGQVMLAMKRVQKLYMASFMLSGESRERLLADGRALLAHYQKNPHCVFILSGNTMKIMGSPKEFKKLMRDLRRNLGRIMYKTITVPKAFLESVTKEKILQMEGKHRVKISKIGFKTQMMRSVQVTGVDFDVRNCVHDLNKLWRKLTILPEVDLIPDSDRAEIHRPPRDWRDRFFAYQKAYLPPPLQPPGQTTNIPPIKVPPPGALKIDPPTLDTPSRLSFNHRTKRKEHGETVMPKPPSPIFAPMLPSPRSNLHSPVFSTPVRNHHSDGVQPSSQSRIASSLFDDVEPAASKDMPAMSGSSFPYKNIGSRWN